LAMLIVLEMVEAEIILAELGVSMGEKPEGKKTSGTAMEVTGACGGYRVHTGIQLSGIWHLVG
jgi:hypothetical protein